MGALPTVRAAVRVRALSNQGISFNNKMVNDPKKIANHFNTKYTPGPST